MSNQTSGSLTCARLRVLLESYVDGELARDDATLAARVTHHLAGCGDCRRQHHQAVSIPFRLRALTSPSPTNALATNVMKSVVPSRTRDRRAWTLLAPEAILASFILWYLSGLDGLKSIGEGIFGDLLGLAGWGSGTGPLPSVPEVDVILLLALIALAATAAYHLSVLVRLSPGTMSTRRRA